MWTLAWVAAAWAQAPDDGWRTAVTEHYRVHYPVAAEGFALPLAARLDGIYDAVTAEVGYSPPGRLPIVVADPYTTANGMALPLLHQPRMVYWSTPPEASSVLGNYGSFPELLAVHETTHVVHLVRPSRNPLIRGLDEWIGVGPITRKAPRWVIEGYATVVEARLTGFGRPYGDHRAAWLRELARQGRMPTYAELDGNARWQGGGDAYLVGSAFLEWLEAREGAGALRDLWARMTARKVRDFDDAFRGVFGDEPSVLYGRFQAELVQAALEAEAARPSSAGELFLDLDGGTGAPTVSDDGGWLAAVVRDEEGDAWLTVWGTAVDEEAEADRAKKQDKRAARDPEDVADVDPLAPPHEEVGRRLRRLRVADAPRFLPDGALLFTAYRPDAEGRVRPDLYRWHPEDGGEKRLTRGEDLADADPSPDGAAAIAVRKRFGATDLVRVDLGSGDATVYYDAPDGHVVDRPRWGPQGEVLWLENGGAGFGLRLSDAEGGPGVEVKLPEQAAIFDAAWASDGTLYATLGVGGFVEVWHLVDGGWTQVTRSGGAVGAVEPALDGSLFVLAPGPDGASVRRVVPSPVASGVPEGGDRAVYRQPALPVAPFPEGPVSPHPYGVGRVYVRPLVGGLAGKGSGMGSYGLRAGDSVGRWEALGQVAFGADTWSGSRLTLDARVLPLTTLRLGGYQVIDPAYGRWGVEAGVSTRIDSESRAVRVDLGALSDQPWPGDPRGARAIGYGAIGLEAVEPRTGWLWLDARLAGRATSTDGEPAQMLVGEGSLYVGPYGEVELSYATGGSSGPDAVDHFVIGGVASPAAPDAWALGRRWDPLLAPTAPVAVFDAMKVGADVQGFQVFAKRVRYGDTGLTDARTVAGLALDYDLGEQPIVRLPAAELTMGIGCVLEGEDGWDASPCDALGDYTFWSGVNWRP